MTRQPSTLRVRDEIDLLALVPYTFGFHPEDSLVVVSLDRSGRPFSARTDLPTDVEDVDLLVDQLVFPVRRSAAEHAFLIAYTVDRSLAEAAVGAVGAALEEAGVRVLLAVRADGCRWWPVGAFRGAAQDRPAGTPYDLSSHPLTTQAVADGKVTFASREELAASLEPVGWEPLEAVAEAFERLGALPRRRRELRKEAAWLSRCVRGLAAPAEASPDRPGAVMTDPTELARVLRALTSTELRDVVLCEVTRDSAEVHVVLWSEVVRRSPDVLVAAPAGMLAFAAWQAGHGALAWCAVERSLAADPDHGLATLVRDALDSATSPDVWEPRAAESLPLYAH